MYIVPACDILIQY